MIIGNNNPRNNLGQNNSRRINNNNIPSSSMPNTFENRWNKIQEYNHENHSRGNGFVKKLEDQKYSSSTDTAAMHDRSLAMLQDRLEKGTISLEEFNKKCAALGTRRQNMSKKNKLF